MLKPRYESKQVTPKIRNFSKQNFLKNLFNPRSSSLRRIQDILNTNFLLGSWVEIINEIREETTN